MSILQGVGSGSTTSNATGIPPGLLALPNGTLLRGTVTRLLPQGLVVLNTPKGEVSLKSAVPLLPGNEIVLRLETATSGLKARIVSVDGLSPKELGGFAGHTAQDLQDIVEVEGQPRPTTATAAETAKPVPPVEVRLPQDTLIKAILLSRAENLPEMLRSLPKAIPYPQQRLDAGAIVSVRIVPQSLQLPVAMETPAQTVLPPLPAGQAATAPMFEAALPMKMPAPASGGAGYAPGMPQTPALQTMAAATPASPAFSAFDLPDLPTADNPVQVANPAPPQPPLQSPGQPAHPASIPREPAAAVPLAQLAASVPTPVPTTPGREQAFIPPAVSQPSPAQPAPAAPTLPTAPQPMAATNAPVPPAAASQSYQSAFRMSGITLTTLPATPAAPLQFEDAPHLLAQGVVRAEVIGTEKSGETVVRTALGLLKMDLPMATPSSALLPPGTRLDLQLEGLENDPLQATAATSPGTTVPAPLSELSSQWQSLQELSELLKAAAPGQAAQILQQIIPQAGPKMASGMLFFLSALGAGDVRKWVGDKTVELLEKAQRGDVVRKLGTEFGLIRQLYVDSPNPHWQAVFVPVMVEQELHQARLYIKKDEPGKNPQDSQGLRFIMEVELSQFGPMQLDGFVRKQSGLQFDLLVRTTHSMPERDRYAIRSIYADASATAGFKGQIGFQISKPFPVQPMEEILEHDRNFLA